MQGSKMRLIIDSWSLQVEKPGGDGKISLGFELCIGLSDNEEGVYLLMSDIFELDVSHFSCRLSLIF